MASKEGLRMFLAASPYDALPFLSSVNGETLKTICYVFVAVWILLELVFFAVLHYLVVPKLQPLQKPQPCPTDPVDYIRRVLTSMGELQTYTIESYLSGFFRGAKFEDIRDGNLTSFLAWAMYGKHHHDLPLEHTVAVGQASEMAKDMFPKLRDLPEGFNPEVKHVAFNLEQIPHIHRPLCFYIAIGILEIALNAIFLRMCGFQLLFLEGSNYWYKPSPREASKDPLMFFHGISTGWAFYLNIIQAMGEGRGVILVDVDAIKVKSLVFQLPSSNQFVAIVMKILKRHKIAKVSLAGHSFGSITAGWIASAHPEVVSHLTLLDPVSLLLALPDVAYNFLYRPPSKITEWLIFWAASREITISNMLYRHFYWYRNNLWLEDIPSHIGVVVGVASHDEITSPHSIFEYTQLCHQKRIQAAEKEGTHETRPPAKIECVMWNGYSHGQILLSPASLHSFLDLVHRNEKTSQKLD